MSSTSKNLSVKKSCASKTSSVQAAYDHLSEVLGPLQEQVNVVQGNGALFVTHTYKDGDTYAKVRALMPDKIGEVVVYWDCFIPGIGGRSAAVTCFFTDLPIAIREIEALLSGKPGFVKILAKPGHSRAMLVIIDDSKGTPVVPRFSTHGGISVYVARAGSNAEI